MIDHAALFAVIMSAPPMCLCCPCLCLSSLHNTIQLIDCSSLACSFFSPLVCLCQLLPLSWTSAVGLVRCFLLCSASVVSSSLVVLPSLSLHYHAYWKLAELAAAPSFLSPLLAQFLAPLSGLHCIRP